MISRREFWIVCAGIAFVAALWFWYGILGTLTVQNPGGVDVLAHPVPLAMDPHNMVLGRLQRGERVDVYGLIYGKDYLAYRISLKGETAYVGHYGNDVRFEYR